MNTFQKFCTLFVVLLALGLSGCASMNSIVKSGQDLGKSVTSQFKGHAFVVGTVTAAPQAENMDTTDLTGGGHALSVQDQAKILRYEMDTYFKKAQLAAGSKPPYRVNVVVTAVKNRDSSLQFTLGYVHARVTITTTDGHLLVAPFTVAATGPGTAYDGSSCLALAERFNTPAIAVNLASGLLALQQGRVNTIGAAMMNPYADNRSEVVLDSPTLRIDWKAMWPTERSWKPHPIAYQTIEKIIGKRLAAYGCPVKEINRSCHGCSWFPEDKQGLNSVYGLN